MTSKEIKKAVISSTTYKIGEGFLLDIVCNAESDPYPLYQAWFWHKDYGIKEFLFGSYQDHEDFIETALHYAEDFKDYYVEKYMEG